MRISPILLPKSDEDRIFLVLYADMLDPPPCELVLDIEEELFGRTLQFDFLLQFGILFPESMMHGNMRFQIGIPIFPHVFLFIGEVLIHIGIKELHSRRDDDRSTTRNDGIDESIDLREQPLMFLVERDITD